MLNNLITDAMVASVGKAIIIFIVGLIVITLILKAIKKVLMKSRIDESAHKFFISVIRVVLWIIVLVAILGAFNISTAPIVTVLGAAGIGIALAMQNSLSNVAGGIMIMYNKLFIKDEYINVAGTAGLVDEIGIFATNLKTFDNKSVTIPNGLIVSSVLTNYSREEDRRVDLNFTISYNTDIAKAKRVLAEVASGCEQVDNNIEPIVVVTAHADSAIELVVRAWCKTPDYWDVYFYLMENVKLAFDREGIEIPFPQMDVHQR
ncbi:MAG: mechanosensitive ion channel [Peptostreptococcaceae bacterium]|nr:mechanosensitive ion channel [Peptostreptococcaceae bacterium]